MVAFNGLMTALCTLVGIYYLFYSVNAVVAVYFLLMGLYFYVTMFEMRQEPFPKNIYLLLAILLLADGLFNFFSPEVGLLGAIINLVFGLRIWFSYLFFKNKA